MRKIHHRACNLCEAICGLRIEVEDEQIISIKGDPDDPLSRGHICPKAVALQDLQNDPDRLRKPIRKRIAADGQVEWEELAWPDAMDLVAERLTTIYSQQGVDAIGIYLGNPTVHNYGMMTHQKVLFTHLRTRNRYSATSCDQLPHHMASLWLFGHKSLFPIPDIDRSDYFLMLGANPIASNGSIWTVPDVRKRIKELKKRGGKLVVLDPRKTETAEIANEHHFIRPGADVTFLLAVLNCLFSEKLVKLRDLAPLVTGLEQVEAALAEFDAEWAAPHCGVDADSIRRISRELAAAEAGVCYGRMGVSTQAFGALNQWLIYLINIVTGNLDRPGGSLFTTPAMDPVATTTPGGFDRVRSRVRGLPEFDRELPVAALAEEILTPGDGQIRALFTGAGNPVLSTPNGRQLDEALDSLEFMVSLDPYLNETTRHADVILPPTSPLEHDHFDLSFHLNAVRNTVRMNEAVFTPPEGSLHDWQIFNGLGARVARILGLEHRDLPDPQDIVAMAIEYGPYGAERGLTLAEVREHPSGIDLGPLRSQFPGRLRTPDKKLNCATPEPLADLARVRERFSATTPGLMLIGRRDARTNNSWMHNFHRLVKGRDRCTVMAHPRDLASRGIEAGERVQISSRVGMIELVVEVSEDIMPGVISIPHGWGHNRNGLRMAIASAHGGESCNDLTDDQEVDVLSGNAVLNGVPVELKPLTLTS